MTTKGTGDLALPGYRVAGPVVQGPVGESQAAREVATGRAVTLHRPQPGDRVAADAVRAQARLLGGLSHPHLARPPELVESPAGPVLVSERAAGTLADVLTHGPLTVGMAVTACGPVAQALAALHRSGVVHGAVHFACIEITTAGRPLLGGLLGLHPAGSDSAPGPGARRFAAPEVLLGEPATPAADVYALAAVVRAVLGGTPSTRAAQSTAWPGVAEGVASELDRALATEPGLRPGADELSTALMGMAAPEPLVLPPSLGSSRRLTPRASRRPKVARRPAGSARHPAVGWGRVSVLIAVPLFLAGAVLAGVQWARLQPVVAPASLAVTSTPSVSPASGALPSQDPPPQNPPTPAARHDLPARASPSFPPTQRSAPHPPHLPSGCPAVPGSSAMTSTVASAVPWPRVVRVLYARRAAALESANPAALCAVYARDSAALLADLRRLRRYSVERLRVRDLDFRVHAARLVTRREDSVVLAVTDRLAPYRLVDADGVTIAELPGLARTTWRLVLAGAPDGSGWLLG